MDVICVFGRGIEKVKTSSGYVWRPTRLIEKLSEEGTHTGFRVQGLNPDDDDVVIAGANANVLASSQLFEELSKTGNSPSVVIFAAGRPQYLADDPDPTLSEGKVLAEKFVRIVKLGGANMPEVVIQSGNQNTRDDMEQTLRFVSERNLKQLAIITVSTHMGRVKELFGLFLKENPQLKNLEVQFFDAEKVLLNRYRAVSLYKKVLAQLQNSVAYQRTKEKEQRGIEVLLSGNYHP